MIIKCINCNKNFDIDKGLIPNEGRLLQCSSCNYKWFFKNLVIPKSIVPTETKNLEIFEPTDEMHNELFDSEESVDINYKNDVSLDKEITSKKKIKLVNITIVLMISFISLIILLDTFKSPISKIFPSIEFLLYNLYESIKDILLFIKDLI
jgi:predicted Zn finger-like uncharacterized protein